MYNRSKRLRSQNKQMKTARLAATPSKLYNNDQMSRKFAEYSLRLMAVIANRLCGLALQASE
jgi:hypothetical protein